MTPTSSPTLLPTTSLPTARRHVSVCQVVFSITLHLPPKCDFTLANTTVCLEEELEDFESALNDGSFLQALQNSCPVLFNSNTVSMSPVPVQSKRAIQQKYPTSIPSSSPSTIPTSPPSPEPTFAPTNLVVSISPLTLGIFSCICVIAFLSVVRAYCFPNINKVKILAMVNEVLEEDERMEETKDNWERRKPGYYDDDDDDSYY